MDNAQGMTGETSDAPPTARRRTARWVALVALVLLVLLLAAGSAGVWLLRSERGSQWLLAQVPGLRIEGQQGSPLGERFAARRVHLVWSDGAGSLTLEELSWQGARWAWMPEGGAWAGVRVDALRVARLQLRNAPSSEGRRMQPGSLRVPVQLAVASVRIERLQVDDQAPLEDLQGSVELGAAQGAEHRVQWQQLRWHRASSRGQARLGADPPFALDLQSQAQAEGEWPWDAELRLRGPLASIDTRLRLSSRPGAPAAAGAAPAALDAQAQLRPFEAWPLGDVTATTRAFDLASLVPGAPHTRLDGHVRISSQGLRQPIGVNIELDNASPARWAEGGLPVHSLRLKLLADPRRPDRLVLGPFEIQAADAQGAAGRWSGSGVWEDRRLELQTRIVDLQPQRLDAHLSPMRLGGPLSLVVDGLPSPDPQAGKAAWGGWQTLTLDSRGQLDGHIAGAPEGVTLAFELKADGRTVDLVSLRAGSGAARAQLRARAQQAADGRWQLGSDGELAAFDPALWVPGRDDAPWRRGPNRLNARWTLDLTLPKPRAPVDPARWLADAAGTARLTLVDSRVAGVPAQAQIEWQQGAPTGRGERGRGRADVRLASTQIVAEAAVDPGGDGREDRLQLQLQSPAVAELAPLFAWLPALKDWTPRQGALELQATLRGRGAGANVELQGRASELQAGPLGLALATVAGRWDGARTDGLSAQVDATRLRWGEGRVDNLRARLQGSLATHRFEADAVAPGQPSPALAQALLLPTGPAAGLRLAGSGGWTGASAGGGRWAGQVERLWLGPTDGAATPAPGPHWLDSRGLQLEAVVDAAGGVSTLSLQPGQAAVGPLTLRWTEARWQAGAGDGPSTWRLKAEVPPVAVAPWLQQARNGSAGALQWSGDLRASAQLDIRAGTRFEADLRVQRDSGDLRFSDGTTSQALGLGQAEIELTARDGLWRLTPRIQGERLGRIGGEWIARGAAADRWPAPGAALDGRLEVQVPALAAWAGWLPPGWRLQGALDAQARLSGTVHAPSYAGHFKAERVAIRNVLQGVDLTDGTLDVQLRGDQARIETLSLRAGDGQLTAQGHAAFGARPELMLTARADKLRVLGRIDRQLVVNGQAVLRADAQRVQLEGRVAADSGLFDLSRRDAPTLDEDVSVSRSAEPEPPEIVRREPTPLMRSLLVNVDLDLGPRLRLRGRGLDTLLTGTLKLTAPNGRPQLHGTVRAERGTYAAYGQKMEIERGLVIFTGPIDGARLDVLALRPNLDMRVGVAITGPALDPRVRLYSEPDLAETDKLSWLVMGRGPDGLGRTDTAVLQRAALALLAGEGESPSDAVLRTLGIDDFSIRQSDGEVRDTVLSVGKQISRRWYVGYERGVNATSGTWQLIYRAAQRFTLRAQSGDDNSIDMIWTWRFGRP